MKIALVHRRLSRQGGVEKNAYLLAAGLAGRGHDVHMLCAEVRSEVPRGVTLRPITMRGLSLGARFCSFAQHAADAVTAERFDVVQGFDLTWKQDVMRLGRGLVRVYGERLEEKRSAIDRFFRRIRPGKNAFGDLETKMIAPGATKIFVTNSNVVKRELIDSYSVDAARIEVIHNGIDPSVWSPDQAAAGRAAMRARFGFSGEDRVVLHVGGGFLRKGVDVTLRAFARLAAREPRARLLVVGTDSHARRYRTLARTLAIADRVVFAGSVKADSALYGAGDVLCSPSRYEPFGNAILEALACGVPAIHSRSGGASEVLEADGLGRFVLPEAEDDARLAEMLESAMAEDRAALALACRAVAEKHHQDDCVVRYEELYRRIVP